MIINCAIDSTASYSSITANYNSKYGIHSKFNNTLKLKNKNETIVSLHTTFPLYCTSMHKFKTLLEYVDLFKNYSSASGILHLPHGNINIVIYNKYASYTLLTHKVETQLYNVSNYMYYNILNRYLFQFRYIIFMYDSINKIPNLHTVISFAPLNPYSSIYGYIKYTFTQSLLTINSISSMLIIEDNIYLCGLITLLHNTLGISYTHKLAIPYEYNVQIMIDIINLLLTQFFYYNYLVNHIYNIIKIIVDIEINLAYISITMSIIISSQWIITIQYVSNEFNITFHYCFTKNNQNNSQLITHNRHNAYSYQTYAKRLNPHPLVDVYFGTYK